MAKKSEKQKIKRGAPEKSYNDKKGARGLTNEQNDRLQELADERGVPLTAVLREAVDWYLDSVETAKITASVNHDLETEEVVQELAEAARKI